MLKRIAAGFAAIMMAITMAFAAPTVVYADETGSNPSESSGCVETTMFGSGGQYCDGIWGVLAIVLNVMLIVAGAGGIIGIIVSGIQYATAAGDPGQMTKAKRRIYEIMIGLVALGLMWAFIQWIIPGGVL